MTEEVSIMGKYQRNKKSGKNDTAFKRSYAGIYENADMENRQTREERTENFDLKKWLRTTDL